MCAVQHGGGRSLSIRKPLVYTRVYRSTHCHADWSIGGPPCPTRCQNSVWRLCRISRTVAPQQSRAVLQAIQCYEQCMRLCPASPNAFQNRLLALNYIHPGEQPHVCAAHADWGAAFAAQVQTLPPVDRAAWPPLAGRRLRVGYLSPDLYRHSVSYFAEAPLRHHDRSRIEVRLPHLPQFIGSTS